MGGAVARGLEAWLRTSGAGGFLFLGLCFAAQAVAAEPGPPRTEYFTGFEASDNYASGYVGAGYAFGKAGFRRPGFACAPSAPMAATITRARFRSTAPDVPTTFDGQNAFGAALLGYEFRPGASNPQAVRRHRG